MARSEFGARLGYVRWLFHLLTGESPSFAEIGKAVGVSGQAVSGWAKRAAPPVGYESSKALVAFFGVDEDWLIGGHGDPPRPDLWRIWIAARTRRLGALPPAIGSLEEIAPSQERKAK